MTRVISEHAPDLAKGKYPLCYLHDPGLAVLENVRPNPYNADHYHEFRQDLIDIRNRSLCNRQDIVGRLDTRLNAPGGGVRPTVPLTSVSSNGQRIIADSPFNHTQLGVSTFGIMPLISATAYEIHTLTHTGLDQQRYISALGDVQKISLQLLKDTNHAAKNTRDHTIASALRLADKAPLADQQISNVCLPTITSNDMLDALSKVTNKPLLRRDVFDNFYGYATSLPSAGTKLRLYCVQP